MTTVLPVTIIGGFLGSGKTTLVNHLLRHANGVRLAVLVNDFGDLPIDADLIEGQEGDVINLSGGCVCCSYGDDLSLSLQKLQAQPNLPDHIFIEASGVALPGAIGQSLSLLRAFQLEGIVVLADVTTVQAAAAQKYIADTIVRQLNDADLIVLNKLDLLSGPKADAVRQWIAENYAQAPQVDAIYGTIIPEVLFEIKRSAKVPTNDSKAHEHSTNTRSLQGSHSSHNHSVNSIFSTISLKVDHAVDANTLAAQLSEKRCGLVRAKGFVLDIDSRLKTIQVVGRRWSVTPAPKGVTTGLVCIAQAAELSESNIRSLCNLDRQAVV